MTKPKNIKEHPEGIEVAIGILENVPEELLRQYSNRLVMQPHNTHLEVWKETIDDWFDEDF